MPMKPLIEAFYDVSGFIDHNPRDASRTPRGQRISRGPLDAANSRLEELATKRLLTTRNPIAAISRRPGVLGGAPFAARRARCRRR